VFFHRGKVSAPARVYDCFLFYNELELLEVRLKEMAPYVDKFVIVEACETFRGAPKAFTFAENRERFAAYADQIVYVPLTERLKTEDAWTRERHQRAQVLRGLKGCKPHDVVFLSDVDEIVRGARIPRIAELIASGEAQTVVCRQNMYFGYLNRYWDTWPGTVCMRYGDMKRIGIKKMRRLRNGRPRLLRKTGIRRIQVLPEAGWHFTSMGGLARYAAKLEAYSHSEADTPEAKSATGFQQKVQNFTLCPLDDSFPACIRERRTHYEAIGFLEKK
jgi:hypothetical protein